jgi:hypothetical protein
MTVSGINRNTLFIEQLIDETNGIIIYITCREHKLYYNVLKNINLNSNNRDHLRYFDYICYPELFSGKTMTLLDTDLCILPKNIKGIIFENIPKRFFDDILNISTKCKTVLYVSYRKCDINIVSTSIYLKHLIMMDIDVNSYNFNMPNNDIYQSIRFFSTIDVLKIRLGHCLDGHITTNYIKAICGLFKYILKNKNVLSFYTTNNPFNFIDKPVMLDGNNTLLELCIVDDTNIKKYPRQLRLLRIEYITYIPITLCGLTYSEYGFTQTECEPTYDKHTNCEQKLNLNPFLSNVIIFNKRDSDFTMFDPYTEIKYNIASAYVEMYDELSSWNTYIRKKCSIPYLNNTRLRENQIHKDIENCINMYL